MRSLEEIDSNNIQVSEASIEELHSKGYYCVSYDGDLSLRHDQRTSKNCNGDGDLTFDGAKIIARDTLLHLKGVKDVQIVQDGNAYDVYVLPN